MCRSTVDIHSATAEIRRGKQRRKKKPQGRSIISASATQGGNNKIYNEHGSALQSLCERSSLLSLQHLMRMAFLAFETFRLKDEPHK